MRLLLNLNNVLLIKMFFKNQWHRESFGTSVGSPQVLKAKRGGKKKNRRQNGGNAHLWRVRTV